MEFHFVIMKPTRGYMTLTDPSGKTRSLCFKTSIVAEKYVNYTSNFRAKHGVWPNLDMTQELTIVKSRPVKKRSPEEVSKFMEVVCMSKDDLDVLGRVNGMSFFYVIDFETNGYALNFKGQEIDGFPDQDDYTNNLKLRIM